MSHPSTVIVIAHGSRAAGTREAHLELVDELARELAGPVLPAFLELTDPDIPSTIDAAVAGGAAHIVLVPYFLHHGNHTRRDIPEIIAAARDRHPGLMIEMTAPLGPDPRLIAITAERARLALASAGVGPAARPGR